MVLYFFAFNLIINKLNADFSFELFKVDLNLIFLNENRDFFGTDNPYANILDHFADPPPRKTCPAAEGVKKKDEPVIKKLPLTLEEVNKNFQNNSKSNDSFDLH